MIIGGFQKFSMIDYPEKFSAIVFTQGCNFRCPYCHNPELLLQTSDSLIKESLVFDFLKTRIGKLDAVVVSGGEPCLQSDLVSFVQKIKDMGFLVKLDTNGSFPDKLQELINLKLVDYIAMDIKAPIEKYKEITNSAIDTYNILRSIDIIINSNIDHEFRTTIVKSQLSEQDILQIGELIKSAKRYFLQKFIPLKTLDKNFAKQESYLDKELIDIKTNFEEYNFTCLVR